jgi:UDP-N-acetyl-D-mannosaminuronic acid dehydrogenase
MDLNNIRLKVKKKQAKIAVVGLGYVGLPVACTFASVGFHVTGMEIRQERVEKINNGINLIEGEEPGLSELLDKVVQDGYFSATTDYEKLRDVDIVLIDVETPVDENHVPQYVALRSACESLGQVLKEGALVIIESTIAPGTVKRVVQPILEKATGRKLNQGFYLGACPERVMPGKLLSNLSQMSRVCGGSTPEVADLMVELYRNFVQGDLDTAEIITAELVKTTENAYRDVQIAFANEVALICEANGADVWKVRELVNKSPSRNMHLPGAGVGGHCIPKDPWLLMYGVNDQDIPVRLLPAARAVNNGMPIHMGHLLKTALEKTGKPLNGARILMMGFSYLEESDDTRNTPSEALFHWLTDQGAETVIHDPWVEAYQGELLEKARGCDAVVVMVAHQVYKKLNLKELKQSLKGSIVVDGRKVFTAQDAADAGLTYIGLGQG